MSAPTSISGQLSNLVIGGQTASNINISVGTGAGLKISSSGVTVQGAIIGTTMGLGKNRLLNGDMRIDQRNAGAAKILGSSSNAAPLSTYTVDRWQAATGTASGSLVAQQVSLSNADVVATGLSKAVQLSPVPMNGLYAYVPFDGYSASDTIGGFTASNVTGSLSFSTTNSKIGTSCLNLTANPTNGTAVTGVSYTVPSSLSPPITISAWFCPTGFNSYQFIYDTGSLSSASSYSALSLTIQNSNILYATVYISGASSYQALYSGVTYVANTWYHVALTIPYGGAMSLWLNGTLVASSGTLPSTGRFVDSVGNSINLMRLGSTTQSTSGTQSFQGYIDDFRVYKRALSASEIATLAGNVGLPQAPPANYVQPLDYSTRLTFDSTTADAMGVLAAPTIVGTATYSTDIKIVGSASYDFSTNPCAGVPQRSLTYSVSVPSAFSTSVWIYPLQVGTSTQSVVSFLGGGTYSFDIGLSSTGVYLDCCLSSNTGTLNQMGFSNSATYIPANQWTHIATTMSSTPSTAGTLCLYINGVLMLSSSTVSGYICGNSSTTAVNTLMFGSWKSVQSYTGYVDDFRIYNRVLSAAEIALLAGNVSAPPALTSLPMPVIAAATPVSSGLTWFLDPSVSTCYSGSGSSMTNLAATGGSATLGGTYSYVSPFGAVYIQDTGSSDQTNLSYLQFPTVTNIATVSMWYYLNYPATVSGFYLIDSRTGSSGGYLGLWSGNIQNGGDWQTSGYVNGGALQTFTYNALMSVGQWIHVTFLAQNINSDDLTLFSRYNQIAGANVTFGPIMIYNRIITQAENTANYNLFSGRFNNVLLTQLTFDNNTTDSMKLLTTPTVTGTMTYNTANPRIGTACLDLTANTSGAASASKMLVYPFTASLPITVSFWINPSTTSAGSATYIVPLMIGNATTWGWEFSWSSSTAQMVSDAFMGASSRSTTPTSAATTVYAGVWTHVAATLVAGGQNILYLNGVPVAQAALASGALTASNGNSITNMRIGSSWDASSGQYVYQGLIDDVRIYNTALTPIQIMALSQAQSLTTQLTFDNTTADAMGALGPASVTGTIAYSSTCKVGTTCLDLTANSSTTTSASYSIALPTTFTVSYWMYIGTGSRVQVPISFGTSSLQGWQFVIGSGNTMAIESFPNGVNYTTTSSYALTVGQWYHMCGVYVTGVSCTLYVNGMQAGYIALGSGSFNCNTLLIGNQTTTSGNNSVAFRGYLDDVRIYNSALIPSQVAGLYYASPNTAPYVIYQQPIEGTNVADLAWGTSNASSVTVSAWMKNNSAMSNAQQFTLALNNSALNNSLYAWYPFENNLFDASGNQGRLSRTGTGVSLSSTAKVGSYGLAITGNSQTANASSSSYAQIPSTLQNTNGFTVAMWFYYTGPASLSAPCYSLVYIYGQNGSAPGGLSLFIDTDSQAGGMGWCFNTYTATTGGQNAFITKIQAVPNTWVHIAQTSDGNYTSAYINGVAVNAPVVASGAFNSVTGGLWLGYTPYTSGNNSGINGIYDDVRIYGSALTPAQVWQLYQANATQTALAPNLPTRSYLYTTPSLPANTWSKVSFTVPGDIAGTWGTTNTSAGLTLGLTLGAASSYTLPSQVVATTSNATVSSSSNYTICSYTTVGSGTFTVTSPGFIDFLIVGGGGGGAGDRGPGGGAGGCIYGSNVPIAAGTYGVTVGAGGAGGYQANGGTGGNSSFSVWTAYGGGGGGFYTTGFAGGCGGGGHGQLGFAGGAAKIGGQGFAGGNGYYNGTAGGNPSSGGGGGIGGQGITANSTGGGDGGPGLPFDISGTLTYYGGGGGGSKDYGSPSTYSGKGGIGGGGAAGQSSGAGGTSGTANTGGGGGGSANFPVATGGSGGSGIVIIRYVTAVPTAAAAWNSNLYLTSNNIQIIGGSSNNFMANVGNSLLMTGVQLEKGPLATGFELQPLALEQSLVQRYYEKSYNQTDAVGTVTMNGAASWSIISANRPYYPLPFKTPKRMAPNVTLYNPNSGAVGTARNVTASSDGSCSVNGSVLNNPVGDTAYNVYWPSGNTGQTLGSQIAVHFAADAEL